MKKESVLKCCKMFGLGVIDLVGTWFLQKIVLVDNFFKAWALTELYQGMNTYLFSNLLLVLYNNAL